MVFVLKPFTSWKRLGEMFQRMGAMGMKKKMLLLAGKMLTAIAVVFATMPCVGRLYEAEVPEQLRK